MSGSSNIGKWALAAAVVVVVGVAAFFGGRDMAASGYKAERELDIKINRSKLDGLGEIQGPIYVAGHKSPDMDTVGSAIGYAALLRKLGYDATPVVLGDINNETRYVLECAGVEVPELLEDASGLNMVLVDHSEYIQSADGLADANVITILDHHGDGSVTTGNQLIYDARPLGATATIVWTHYRDYGIEIDKETAYVMAGSLLSDTSGMKNESSTFADREALKDLARIAGIDDTDALYKEMFKASIAYPGMTDEQIYLSDYKNYEAGATRYGIACVNAYDEEAASDLSDRMNRIIEAQKSSEGVDMAFAQVNIYHDDISITYIVPSDDAAKEVIESAFGDTAVFDGTAYRFEPGMSRKKTLVPALNSVLEATPAE